jgi:two-component system cell cycle response regulator
VLAVDDQRYFRELIEGLLTDEGYEVVTAAGGEEALHVLERADFEVIVTDLVMPGMDGVELVRRVKERKPDQEIVMVTGVSDVNSAIEAMKQGATDYLLKPLDAGLLAGSLDDILQRRRIAEEHARLMSENQEYLGALALYERATGLFSTLTVQPLGERFIEGLCLETRAQGGVLWAASELGEGRLQLVAARGIIRVDDEPRELVVSRLGPELQPLVEGGGPIVTSRRADSEPGDRGGSALFVPLRQSGDLIGLARLSDKLEGEDFGDSDATRAQAFARFGELAVGNALRFRELERRSLRDPRSGAYTHAYFEDVVRNEIQKVNRFGRPFSIARLHLGQQRVMREELGDSVVESWRESMVHHISRVLRSTDLLCAGNDGHFSVLLPETDAMAGGVLLQRMREGLKAEGMLDPVGGQLESRRAEQEEEREK